LTAIIFHIPVLCICEKCSIVGEHQRFGGTCYFLLQCRSEWGQGVVTLYIFYSWVYSYTEPGPPHCWDVEITLTHTSLSRTPLDERSARHRNLYLKRHKTVKTHTSIPPTGFEPAIRADADPHLRPRGHWVRQSLYTGRMKTGDLSGRREKHRRWNVYGADRTVRPMMFLFTIHVLYSAPHFCMTSCSWQNHIKFELWAK
jgi:hypothetical protein